MKLLNVLPALLIACGDGDEVTWTEVAPVVERHCVSCHQADGIAPMPLGTYAEASLWADVMAAATEARQMPPFLVRGDGECGEFSDNHWLADEEIALIESWALSGAPEGAGATIVVPEPPKLDDVTIEQHTPEFTPQIVGGELAEFDEYRCFMADLELTEDAFLVGYDVMPGNDTIVHHVIGMPVDLDAQGYNGGATNRELIEAMSSPDRDGWPCFSGAGSGVSYDGEVITWAPGQGAVNYPEGVGLRLRAGNVMVYQVHFNLSDPESIGQADQTTIQLKTAPSVDRNAFIVLPDLFLAGEADQTSIPAGQEAATVTFDLPMSWVFSTTLDFQVLGVLPHMHERGTQMYVSFERRNGESTCIAEVQNWDFAWQRMYMHEVPIAFNQTDVLKVECVYDTRHDTEAITPGWGTQNEMCLPGLLVAPGRG